MKESTAAHFSFIVTTKKSSNVRTRPEIEKKKQKQKPKPNQNRDIFGKEKIILISQEHVFEHSSLPTSSTTGSS